MRGLAGRHPWASPPWPWWVDRQLATEAGRLDSFRRETPRFPQPDPQHIHRSGRLPCGTRTRTCSGHCGGVGTIPSRRSGGASHALSCDAPLSSPGPRVVIGVTARRMRRRRFRPAMHRRRAGAPPALLIRHLFRPGSYEPVFGVNTVVSCTLAPDHPRKAHHPPLASPSPVTGDWWPGPRPRLAHGAGAARWFASCWRSLRRMATCSPPACPLQPLASSTCGIPSHPVCRRDDRTCSGAAGRVDSPA